MAWHGMTDRELLGMIILFCVPVVVRTHHEAGHGISVPGRLLLVQLFHAHLHIGGLAKMVCQVADAPVVLYFASNTLIE